MFGLDPVSIPAVVAILLKGLFQALELACLAYGQTFLAADEGADNGFSDRVLALHPSLI
ncbi:hypothetical protein SynROS8604_01567 [Synechococcus sp. ROS8604]|nr:hypothetical protein SynROS8604_01567 [Synechococcus sp. ROS8604]